MTELECAQKKGQTAGRKKSIELCHHLMVGPYKLGEECST